MDSPEFQFVKVNSNSNPGAILVNDEQAFTGLSPETADGLFNRFAMLFAKIVARQITRPEIAEIKQIATILPQVVAGLSEDMRDCLQELQAEVDEEEP